MMLGLGSGFAVIMLIANVKLKVEVDPKVDEVHRALPNLDCGACGFAACRQYANAILANAELLELVSKRTPKAGRIVSITPGTLHKQYG